MRNNVRISDCFFYGIHSVHIYLRIFFFHMGNELFQ